MNSLRVRLILGFALVALAPLTVSMVLLSQRIQATVRAQASDRLDATLVILQGQLRDEGARLGEKLAILGQDPTLKRLYLVRTAGGRELSEHLARQRFLLALDFLGVADTAGATIADAAWEPAAPGRDDAVRATVDAAFRRRVSGPAIEKIEDRVAMAAGAPIVYQGEAVGVVHGGLWLDQAYLARLEQTSGVRLALRDPEGSIVVTSFADSVAGGFALPGERAERVRMKDGTYFGRTLPLDVGSGAQAAITGWVSTAPAERTLAALRATSLLLGLIGVAIAIALGTLWSAQISRPVERLALFSDRIARGHWDEPLSLESIRELDTLVSALDRMRGDLVTYRERLKASERHAAWSLMARQMAHEIKNPLTPIAVSAADLKRSFERGQSDFPQILDEAVRTIDSEVQALKRLLESFSQFGALPSPRLAPCRASDVMDDLLARYGREVSEGRLRVVSPYPAVVVSADREQLRQALVNLIQNAIEATEDGGSAELAARVDGATLEWTVSDTGPGLSAEAKAQVFGPFFTTKAHGTGLGLTIVERIVTEHGGTITVDSEAGRGTTFRVRLPIA